MKYIFIILVAISPGFAFAQDNQQYQKGQIDAQLGIGLISTLNLALNEVAGSSIAEFKWTTLPVQFSVDYGYNDIFSVGGYFGYAASTLYIDGLENEFDKYTIIGVRGLYHVPFSPKFDTYAGGMLGIIALNAKQYDYLTGTDYTNKSTRAGYQIILGARYRFNEHLGVYTEIGYGIAVLNLGLNIKF